MHAYVSLGPNLIQRQGG